MKTRRPKKSESQGELEAQCSESDDNVDVGLIEVINAVDDLDFALKNMSPKYLNIQLWHVFLILVSQHLFYLSSAVRTLFLYS